ncbi:hypothetical protein LT493_04495 [Streptomyces tricolor]|nr:hypothetical protein [Streptomyces tricolor]
MTSPARPGDSSHHPLPGTARRPRTAGVSPRRCSTRRPCFQTHTCSPARPGPSYDADVRRHAGALLQAAAALAEAERPAETEQLRRGLIAVGEVDLAQQTAFG